MLFRPDRHNSGRVDVVVRVVVVRFDAVKVDRLSNARLLIQISQITVKVSVIEDATEVAFKMPVVNRIKSNKCNEQTPVGLQGLRSEEKSPSRESLIQLIQCPE